MEGSDSFVRYRCKGFLVRTVLPGQRGIVKTKAYLFGGQFLLQMKFSYAIVRLPVWGESNITGIKQIRHGQPPGFN